MTGPYEPNWNKLPCCSVNNTWHVCPYLRPWLWLGKILRVDFKANDIQEAVSEPFLSACVEMSGATGGALQASYSFCRDRWESLALDSCSKLCVGAYFWQEANISIFSQKVREGAADRLQGAVVLNRQTSQLCRELPGLLRWRKDALSAPLDGSHLLTELPHMVASALTFIIVCTVLSSVGTATLLHRCCSDNYWNKSMMISSKRETFVWILTLLCIFETKECYSFIFHSFTCQMCVWCHIED